MIFVLRWCIQSVWYPVSMNQTMINFQCNTHFLTSHFHPERIIRKFSSLVKLKHVSCRWFCFILEFRYSRKIRILTIGIYFCIYSSLFSVLVVYVRVRYYELCHSMLNAENNVLVSKKCRNYSKKKILLEIPKWNIAASS